MEAAKRLAAQKEGIEAELQEAWQSLSEVACIVWGMPVALSSLAPRSSRQSNQIIKKRKSLARHSQSFGADSLDVFQ